jgi:tetratricopeptide (TPR) repeat protein
MTQEALIEKYLQGTLNSEEKELVEQLIRTDSGFKKELEFQSNLKVVVVKEEDTSFKATLEDFENNPTLRSKRPISKWLVAATILILVAVGSLLVFPNASTDPLFAQNFEPYANVIQPVVRGVNASDIKTEAFVAYESEDFELAETHFTTLLNSTSDSFVLFYLANTKLALGKPQEAIPLLNFYMSTGGNLGSQAQWYLALAHIQAGEQIQAKEVLQKIITFEGYGAEKAILLLEKIK